METFFREEAEGWTKEESPRIDLVIGMVSLYSVMMSLYSLIIITSQKEGDVGKGAVII
jgi:hypothetical protein